MTGTVRALPRWRDPAVAHRGLRAGLAVRAGLAFGSAGVALVAGILVARAAITPRVFDTVLADGEPVVVTGYSGPMIGVAIALGTLAGLALVAAVTDLWRRRLIGRAAHPHEERRQP